MRKVLLCLLLAPLAGGCAGLVVQPPGVSMVDLKFTDLTVFETSGEITLRLTNENTSPLALEGGVFTLFLEGVKVGKGLTSERMEVPAFESTTHRVPIYINNLALAQSVARLLEEPELDYRIRARLRLATSYGTRRLSSEYSGRFSTSGAGSERPAPGAGDAGDPGEGHG